tara:strand:- start:53 stop:769 length:717 start_codon:yes stop_codon:yes gene_type:complete
MIKIVITSIITSNIQKKIAIKNRGIYKLLTKSCLLILNNKIIKINNMKNIKGCIVMMNHYNIIDVHVFYNLSRYNRFVIVKSDLLTSDETTGFFMNITNFFSKKLFYYGGFIPYKRNDKSSGEYIKKTILEITSKGYNVLIFPEGTSTRDGKSKTFKSGIFRLSSEYNIPIVPITLIYDKNIGLNKEDNIVIENFCNNNITSVIHPVHRNKDWKILKDSVFNIITKTRNMYNIKNLIN